MGSSTPADSGIDAPPSAVEPRPGRLKRRRRQRPAIRYTLIVAGIIVLMVLIQFLVHTARTDPRDTRTIAERELHLNTLEPGERIIRSVSVFKRPALDYFRATRGLLVLTNTRLLYLGLEPRDLLAAPDLPPTFEERDFPIDTLVRVTSGRTFFGIAKAIVITTPNEKLRLGVPSAAWPGASVLIAAMDARHTRALTNTAQQRQFLARAEAQRRAAEADRLKPKYYVVRRGDALGGIATIWNTTADKLRAWNKLPDNKIRIGQILMVRPAL